MHHAWLVYTLNRSSAVVGPGSLGYLLIERLSELQGNLPALFQQWPYSRRIYALCSPRAQPHDLAIGIVESVEGIRACLFFLYTGVDENSRGRGDEMERDQDWQFLSLFQLHRSISTIRVQIPLITRLDLSHASTAPSRPDGSFDPR